MWIMLNTKLGVSPSPPKLSIHWAIPWPHKKFAVLQKKRTKKTQFGRLKYNESSKTFFSDSHPGQESDWANAKKILYKDEYIRIFPNEFIVLTNENLNMYISESHIFRAGTTAQEKLLYDVTDGELRDIHDAALLDGCNEQQAIQTALGIDVTEITDELQPLGWYSIKEEYGLTFCNGRELSE